MTNEQRFEAIYRARYARVWRYFRACRVPDDEAHDLAQDTFKRFYEHLSRLRNDDEWGLLQSIARTILLNYIRDGKAAKRSAPLVRIDDPEFKEEPAAPEEPDYADRQQEAMRKQRLQEEIEKLPEGQRQAMRLWLGDMKYDEIAAALRTSVDAVKSRLRDAKRLLRSRMGAQAVPEDDE